MFFHKNNIIRVSCTHRCEYQIIDFTYSLLFLVNNCKMLNHLKENVLVLPTIEMATLQSVYLTPRASTASRSSLSSSSESWESSLSSFSDSFLEDTGELGRVEVGDGGSEMGLGKNIFLGIGCSSSSWMSGKHDCRAFILACLKLKGFF